jgi:serine/threonine protein kinase
MGFSCKSKSAIAVSNSAQDAGRNDGGVGLERFDFRELEAATGAFARESRIAKASHGDVYRATLHDGRVVAVKRGADAGARMHEDADAFSNEVQILSKLFSRRLVNLLGCSYDGRASLLLVLEHMENGTLHATLQEPLSWSARIQLALDVAKAIRALHASSPPIIHRNIRTTNVFIDRDGHARLGDFCLAKCIEPSALLSIPETDHSVGLADLDPSDPRKTDVFSFGVVLLEIMSGRSADRNVLLDWALPLIKHGHSMAICDPRITPFPDNAAVRLVASVAARCVRSSSARRPSMDEVVQSLTKATRLAPEPTWTTTTTDHPNFTATPTLSKHRLISIVDPTPSDLRSSTWTKLPTVKKRRAIVFRLSRFLARKFRIGARRSSSYDNLPVQKLNGPGSTPLKGAKVSDEGRFLDHKKSVLSNGREHKSRRPPAARFPGSSSHRSGTKFLRL